MENKSPPPVFSKDMSQGACLVELKKLTEKLQRAYQRRDHYAQLYYRVLAELEDTKWELDVAKKKIQELQSLECNKSSNSPGDVNSEPSNEGSFHDQHDVATTPNSSPKPCGSPPSPIDATRAGEVKIIPKPGSADYNYSPKPTAKRVAFSDTPHQSTVIQRSYSVSEGELNGICPPSIIQRTKSFSHGNPNQSQLSAFPAKRVHPPPHSLPSNAYALSYDHRLPRVHRGLAYETAVPVTGSYSLHYPPNLHHHPPNVQHHPSNSAFRIVPPSLIHPADYRNQPRYSSLPGRNQRFLPTVEAGRWRVKKLNRAELITLFTELSTPELDLRKLEISCSGLGNVEMMDLLCQGLKKKNTIEELSLPGNGIDNESLTLLLDTVSVCKNIKHLKLADNDITQDSLETVKNFLEKTVLHSFVLSGNEIEHHTHLLEQPLPQEVNERYNSSTNEAVSASTQSHGIYGNPKSHRKINNMTGSSSLPHNMKFLQI